MLKHAKNKKQSARAPAGTREAPRGAYAPSEFTLDAWGEDQGRNASVTADFRARSGGIKQQLVWVALFILGQRIQRALENAEGVGGSFTEREQDAHQDFTGAGALLGLRTKADLAGDDQWTQLAFGAVVVGGDGCLLGPMIEPGCFLPEDILNFLNARMLRR